MEKETSQKTIDLWRRNFAFYLLNKNFKSTQATLSLLILTWELIDKIKKESQLSHIKTEFHNLKQLETFKLIRDFQRHFQKRSDEQISQWDIRKTSQLQSIESHFKKWKKLQAFPSLIKISLLWESISDLGMTEKC